MKLTEQTQTDDYLILQMSLGRITFLSCQEKNFLSKNIDSYDKLALSSIDELGKLLGKNFSKRVVWDGQENLKMAKAALHFCRQLGIDILLYEEPEYPEILRQISDPPYLLFCRGNVNLLSERSVSVVGTRRLTPAGKKAAKDFSYAAVLDGCNVISGLANGADSYAHRGAIDAYFDVLEAGGDTSKLGRTIAVMPSAIDEILPAANKSLAAKILQCGGLLISEYEPRMQIANWHFVGRNRIIAGLSPATVVVEAPAGSGALITADFALEYGRDVMFHEAAFGVQANQISGMVKTELEVGHAEGKVSTYKLGNTPQKFLASGAAVIKDYKDYCVALQEPPGTRAQTPVQGELFEQN